MNSRLGVNNAALLVMVTLIICSSIARDTIFVMDISNHGTSAPKYASNPEYDVTKNNYSKSGQLTLTGIKEMNQNGKDFRKEYIDQQRFMPQDFDPESVHYHSVLEQSSLMSAYSFNLGAYPDSVSYLEFTDGLSDNNAMSHEKNVRKSLGLNEDRVNNGAKRIPINTFEGFMYWRDINNQCSPIGKKVQSNLGVASQSLDKTYRNSLFNPLASKFGKSQNKLNFDTAHLYLDDYLAAKRVGASHPNFSDQKTVDKLIDEYEKDYYYDGILGGNHVSRVVSSPVLNYLLATTYAKSEGAYGRISNPKYQKLKYAHFFADEVPFASVLKSLDYPQGEAPKPSDIIRFELFTSEGKQFVRSSLNGKPMNIGSGNQGIMEVDTFLKTIYPTLYFGDIDSVCKGKEEIISNIYPRCKDYREYLRTGCREVARPVSGYRVEQHVEIPKCKIVEPVVERVIPIPPPPPPPRVIVEEVIVERPVPVIEEKCVIHEVEKLVAEKPTHVHHLKLEIPENPAVLPQMFAEKVPDAGWPWWLLFLPLLCCIPLLAWLLCRKKAEPEIKPKQPMAPVAAKRLNKPEVKEIMAVKTEERHSPERKYVIEKKVIDEGEDIEMEIQRELGKSRVIRESRQAAVLPRQTAAEIAAEASYARGSGGRRRRIKTIKKFGQVIGKEEQILDEDGNVISSRKLGLDENDPAANYVARNEYVASSEVSYAGSRRGFSSGRHVEDVSPFGAGYAASSSIGGGFRAGGGAGAGVGVGAGTEGGLGAIFSSGIGGAGYGGGVGYGSGAGTGYEGGGAINVVRGASYGSGRHSEGRHSEGRAYSEGRTYGSGRHLAASEYEYERKSINRGGYYVDDV